MRKAASEARKPPSVPRASKLTRNAQTGHPQGGNGSGPRLRGESTDPGDGSVRAVLPLASVRRGRLLPGRAGSKKALQRGRDPSWATVRTEC